MGMVAVGVAIAQAGRRNHEGRKMAPISERDCERRKQASGSQIGRVCSSRADGSNDTTFVRCSSLYSLLSALKLRACLSFSLRASQLAQLDAENAQ